ncbi:MAG TPA: AAA family ATPase, partial [Candidatus Binataceae bacterium]|nr:AAA family ATPase [Candidatus Binataceae bacterium]
MPEQETSLRVEIFVGREHEFAQLRDALDEASEGRGRLFLVHGEPGIGKTSLAEQVARLAQRRAIRALWGRCWEGDGAPAYWPWIQVIRALLTSVDADGRHQLFESERAASMVETVARIVPELSAVAPRPARPMTGNSTDAQQTEFRLFDSIATLLKDAARLGPTVIFLDDLHDADLASLTMLRFLARELRGVGILIVGTYREAEMQRSPTLSAQIGELAREARSLPLAGLSSDEVADFFNRLVGQVPDAVLTERVYEATAGNPLFVDGVVRGLMAGPERVTSHEFNIPHSMREAIGRRLAKLSDQARAILQVAATIGNEFDAVVCGRVKAVALEQVNSWLDEAAQDGIVIALGPGGYRFAHALIRSSIYEDLDTNARVRLHSAIGAALEALYPHNLDAHLDELAHHFRAAGIREKAIDYSHRAGRAASAVFAYAAAAAHWRAAEVLTEGQRDAQRANILHWLGRAEAFFLDPPRGIKHLEDSLSLYQELDDQTWVASINVSLGLALVFLADFAPGMNVARSLDHFRQAQQWQGALMEKETPGWLHRGTSVALFQQARLDEALPSARRAYELWREASIPQWIDAGAWVAQLLTLLGRHREAAAIRQEVLLALQEVRDPSIFQSVNWSIGWAHMVMMNPAEARSFYIKIAEHQGMSSHQRSGAFEFLVQTELQMGNLPRARELAKTHRTNPSFRSLVARFDGEFERAAEMERSMIEWGRRTGHIWDVVASSPSLAAALNLLGDPMQALEVLEETIQLYEPSNYWLEMGIRPAAASLEIILGRPERAEAHLQVCRDILAQGENWYGRVAVVDRAEGRLAAAMGRPFAAPFARAIAIFRRYVLPFDEADTLVSWGSALLGTGDRAEADSKFDAAIAIYRSGAVGQRWIDRVKTARGKPSPGSVAASASSFRREGDSWTIAHNGKYSRLRHVKGLGYIALLLGRPGERVHVIDLVNAIEGGAEASGDGASARAQGLAVGRDLGDVGVALDAQALEEYRQRQSELHAELEAARRDNDPGRTEAARHELEKISDALAGALGRGGRARKNFSHVERARSLVTKHLRSAIDLIRR